MQLANIVLRLGGSQLHTVHKQNVTPAEILVLQAIHGADAVEQVRPVKIDRHRRHASEYDRLAQLYDRAAAEGAFGGNEQSLMSRLFPGAMKKLPLTLKDIGINVTMAPREEPLPDAEPPEPLKPGEVFDGEDEDPETAEAVEAEDA